MAHVALQEPPPAPPPSLSSASLSLLPSHSRPRLFFHACCPYNFFQTSIYFIYHMWLEPGASHLPGKLLTTELSPQFELIRSMTYASLEATGLPAPSPKYLGGLRILGTLRSCLCQLQTSHVAPWP